MSNKGKKLVVCALGGDSLESFLAPQTETPFYFAKYHCASVEAFYHALKIPETTKTREEVTMDNNLKYHRLLTFKRPWYIALGSMIEVGSLEHYVMIKNATRSKLYAHRPQAIEFANSLGVSAVTVSRKGNPSFIDDEFGFSREMYERILRELRRELYDRFSEVGVIHHEKVYDIKAQMQAGPTTFEEVYG